MTSNELRREFLTIIGDTYDQYGYPEYCGWIEGLLLLEPKEWSQRGVAKRLKEIFPASKNPTSISSVNRALKILESFGVLEKAGSRKIGYQYRLVSSSNLVTSILHQLVVVNQDFIRKLEVLTSKSQKSDSELKRAVSYQIKMAESWNKALELFIESVSNEKDV
ncbi:MAG: hypothetical protein ACW99V_05745 [Candidatus Thorarchaeota archaeon]|jgi:DNA-binding transcriptional regulator GbsR (MarR family)